ncbi:hypothetical protein [Streptomyces sp. NPDC001657]|uniref:hypothetical protein n=1 Tax=Streptomyces sp. NPDC001657 TaxID=3154522 RepID=UPI0033279EE5
MSGEGRGVELHIAELAVRGVRLARPDRLGPAFEVALTRLLHDRGVPPGWAAGEVRTPATPLTLPVGPSSDAADIAEGLARAVYGGLGG